MLAGFQRTLLVSGGGAVLRGHPEICLVQPEIPQNVGSIARLCAATQARLHLVLPFGFSTDDRNLRRPGLDYWPFLDLEIHSSLADLLEQFCGSFCFLSKRASQNFFEMTSASIPRLVVFGRETTGLPAELFSRYPDKFYRIPLFHEGVRSLNLANSAAIVLYQLLALSGQLKSSTYGDEGSVNPGDV